MSLCSVRRYSSVRRRTASHPPPRPGACLPARKGRLPLPSPRHPLAIYTRGDLSARVLFPSCGAVRGKFLSVAPSPPRRPPPVFRRRAEARETGAQGERARESRPGIKYRGGSPAHTLYTYRNSAKTYNCTEGTRTVARASGRKDPQSGYSFPTDEMAFRGTGMP